MNPLLTIVIKELQSIRSGEIFLVKDLFKGYEWNRILKGDRLNLGTIFLNHVRDNPNLGIEELSKTSSNQQRYKKK